MPPPFPTDCLGCPSGGAACFQCFTASLNRDTLLVVLETNPDFQPMGPLVTLPARSFKLGMSWFSHCIFRIIPPPNPVSPVPELLFGLVVDGASLTPWTLNASARLTDFVWGHVGFGGQARELDLIIPPNFLFDVYSSGTAASGGSESEGFASIGEPRLTFQSVGNEISLGTDEIDDTVSLDPTVPHTFQWWGKFVAGHGQGFSAYSFHHKFWLVG